MAPGNEINSDKILLKAVFEKWFCIPDYQRPYVWGYDQIHDLLDDITFAATNKPDAEYFMGSLVFQVKPADKAIGRAFDENDLLDGQQRLTTVLLIMAVLRDMTEEEQIKESCQDCIFQRADKYKHIPERVRLVFAIRENVMAFVEQFVKKEGGTKNISALEKFAEKAQDVSVTNMTKAIQIIRDYMSAPEAMAFSPFFDFLLNKVLLIYVSTEDLEDAFRLFTILNDRGIPLRNSDILKSINLGELEDASDKSKYARMWEEAEGELGDDFDRFLAYVRTILVKEKARLSLLREFEDVIYDPKEKDKETQKLKPILLKKGKPTFEIIERYLGHYRQIFGGENHNLSKNYAFDNLIKVMMKGLPATDWIPPLLRYYDKFKDNNLMEFLHHLNRKFAGDWLSQKSPTDRIEAMNAIIRQIDSSASFADVLAVNVFTVDGEAFSKALNGNVYGKRFALYVLLMLDYLYQNHDQRMHFETLSVEHILPQTPDAESQWVKDFDEAARKFWTDRLGNLVLITRRKNTSQGNLDFGDKKAKYFEKNIDTCPNSLRVLQRYNSWTPVQLQENHQNVMAELGKHFGMTLSSPPSQPTYPPIIAVDSTRVATEVDRPRQAEKVSCENLSTHSTYVVLWDAVAEEFSKLKMEGFTPSKSRRDRYFQLFFKGPGYTHYEWVVMKRDGYLGVAIHFEAGDAQTNLGRMMKIKMNAENVRAGVGYDFVTEPWGKKNKWAHAEFRIPFQGDFPSLELASEAAALMKTLIERTHPLIGHAD